MPTSEAQKKATMKWKSENYQRIVLDIKKEQKDKYKEMAIKRNMSLQGYIKWLIEEDMKKEE